MSFNPVARETPRDAGLQASGIRLVTQVETGQSVTVVAEQAML